MMCPEGAQILKEPVEKDAGETYRKKTKKVPVEGASSIELNSLKNPKTWKKSITNFFRNQLRSTRSNDGDRPSGSQEEFEDKDISREQKWQSLGKIFRRQSLAETWNKSPHSQGECSSQNKKTAVRKVISNYFGKNKNAPVSDEN